MADAAVSDTYTWDDHRRGYDLLSEHVEEWQGFPIPLDDLTLVLTPSHPLRELYAENDRAAKEKLADEWPEFRDTVSSEPDGERIVNSWYDRKRNRSVYVIDRGGRRTAEIMPMSPDRSMDRLTMWMMTLSASDAWDVDAEFRAQEKLRSMVSDRQWRHYQLTGTFVETSERSGLTYMLRRLRPTIALSPRDSRGGEDRMHCIAVLCLHPIGYYQGTWSGCMVPTDDLIAHLALMRGDEAEFWGQANAHAPSDAEAGL